MKTINSVSGGKTSSYMAVHYPADYNCFALVLSNDKNTLPKDKGVYKEVLNRIPGFEGTRELEDTLKAVLDLEQFLGTKIDWVVAYEGGHSNGSISDENWNPKPLTFDRLIEYRRCLPNYRMRFCTEELKIKALFWHTYLNIMDDETDVVAMNIGFRFDEQDRAYKMTRKCQAMDFNRSCKVDSKHKRLKSQKSRIDWRIPFFPLIEDRITKNLIKSYWSNKNIDFPVTPDCDMCFFHTKGHLARNFTNYPERMEWALEQEKKIGKTFVKYKNFSDIKQDAPKHLREYFMSENKSEPSLGCQCTD